MHFKNEASPTANSYTPTRRGDQVEIPATGWSASLCARDVSQDAVAHTQIPVCPGRTQS